MKLLKTLSDLADGAEAGVILLAGTGLALALLIGVPGWLTWTLFQEGRVILGSLVLILFALTALGVLGDLRAGRWTWLSTGLAAVWALCTAFVGVCFLIE